MFGWGWGWRGGRGWGRRWLFPWAPGWWWRGNPFPFCRWFPWLPRWWWATPYAAAYAATIPQYLGWWFGYPPYPAGMTATTTSR